MKKKWIGTGGLVIVTLLVLYMIVNEIPMELSMRFPMNANVTEIRVMNGNTGQAVTLDEDDWSQMIQELGKIRISRKYIVEASTGWRYRVTIRMADHAVDVILAGKILTINGKKYQCDNVQAVENVIAMCEGYFAADANRK